MTDQELIKPPFDEEFDTMMEVQRNPTGAWMAIQEQANCIEELVKDRDLWKSRYEHHNHERLETLNLNAMQASKIGSLMNTIAKLEKKISKLEKTK